MDHIIVLERAFVNIIRKKPHDLENMQSSMKERKMRKEKRKGLASFIVDSYWQEY